MLPARQKSRYDDEETTRTCSTGKVRHRFGVEEWEKMRSWLSGFRPRLHHSITCLAQRGLNIVSNYRQNSVSVSWTSFVRGNTLDDSVTTR